MLSVQSFHDNDLDEIVNRVVTHQHELALRCDLIQGGIDTNEFARELAASAHDILVARENGHVVGHLRGTILDSDIFGHSAWMNPGGLSYDTSQVLEALYTESADQWLARNATRHYVWVPPHEANPWLDLGFAYMHQRGALKISRHPVASLPTEFSMRRGDLDDLEIAIELDDVLSDAQSRGPSYAIGLSRSTHRDDWIETLEDPDVYYLIVEYDGHPVAQCATYTLPQRIGTFASSIHLSAVCVREDHQRMGVARAMVDHVVQRAATNGYSYVETNWRVTNRRAARYWTSYGFSPTYVRLHRNVGVG